MSTETFIFQSELVISGCPAALGWDVAQLPANSPTVLWPFHSASRSVSTFETWQFHWGPPTYRTAPLMHNWTRGHHAAASLGYYVEI